MKPFLALITESVSTKTELCQQLNTLLNGYISVVGYATDEGIAEPVSAGLVVFSSQEMYDIGSHFVDPSCPIVIANRTLNLAHLDQLFHIPNHSKVLVVNDFTSNALEVIHLLNEVGLDHLQYFPYGPGDDYDKQIQYAITPGEVDLIPKDIPHQTDIGARVIDISTIIEILTRLELLDSRAGLLSARHLETIIRLNRRLHQTNQEATRMNNYLNRVLNHMNDGILVYNSSHVIAVFNETCETIFGLHASQVIGKTIAQTIRDTNLRQFLMNPSGPNDLVCRIGESEYLFEKMTLDKQFSHVVTIKDTRHSRDLEKKLRHMMMKRGLIAKYHMEDVIGSSQAIQKTIETALKLAKTEHNLLIYGESGVGKEIFANAIHNRSQQVGGPFIAINFSSLSEELAESELFGYEEGSFTGAKKGGRKGLFEEANGGTIFLDEIGDSSPRIQARLLRVLQEKEIRRIGGTDIIPIDVRVIAATNRDLLAMCQAGSFRIDLYHRLKKLYLNIPPLRKRMDDLKELIGHFLRQSGSQLSFSQQAMEALRQSLWPGNVRELDNLIDYLLATCDTTTVKLSDLPSEYQLKSYPAIVDALLEVPELIPFDRAILEDIYQANLLGQSIGRDGVADHLAEKFCDVTSSRVRTRVNWLAKQGYLFIGRGRTGMTLTDRGRQLLQSDT